MSASLNIADIVVHGSEPTVHDLKLAEALGYDQPHTIRKLIRRNEAELARYGELVTVVGGFPHHAENPLEQVFSVVEKTQGGRPGTSYYLNEPQAVLVAVKAGTERAADVRFALIQMFMAWRRGELRPANDMAPAPVRTNFIDLERSQAPLGARAAAVQQIGRAFGLKAWRQALIEYGLVNETILQAAGDAPAAEGEEDSVEVIAILLMHEIGGETVHELVMRAGRGEFAAFETLLAFGVKVEQGGFWLGGTNTVLALYAGTAYSKNRWRDVLRQISPRDGDQRVRFAGQQLHPIWVPLNALG